MNHYLCYRVIGDTVFNQNVFLTDQFHQQQEVVLDAAYLCNPCWKLHNNQEYAPTDTSDHLVLYRRGAESRALGRRVIGRPPPGQ